MDRTLANQDTTLFRFSNAIYPEYIHDEIPKTECDKQENTASTGINAKLKETLKSVLP